MKANGGSVVFVLEKKRSGIDRRFLMDFEREAKDIAPTNEVDQQLIVSLAKIAYKQGKADGIAESIKEKNKYEEHNSRTRYSAPA